MVVSIDRLLNKKDNHGGRKKRYIMPIYKGKILCLEYKGKIYCIECWDRDGKIADENTKVFVRNDLINDTAICDKCGKIVTAE